VGLCTGQIKTGAPCRSERLSKYNQVKGPTNDDEDDEDDDDDDDDGSCLFSIQNGVA